MVDYIRDNFAVWAKYQSRPMAEGWERFAERIVGIDDNGNVVYKNNEAATIEDGASVARELYKYDNSFGGIVFGDTGVPVRINVNVWDNLESFDGSNPRTILSYNLEGPSSPGDDYVAYYDAQNDEWKTSSVTSIHNHDADYVNTVGADSMQGPLNITVGGLGVQAGLSVYTLGASITGGLDVLTNNITCTAGSIEATVGPIFALLGDITAVGGDLVFGYGGKLRSRNTTESTYVDLLQINSFNRIIVGSTLFNTVIMAGTTDEFPWVYHHGSNDHIAPFDGLDIWTDGWIAVWNTANNSFIKVDPSTVGWNKILDYQEFIKAKVLGGAAHDMVGIDDTSTAYFGNASLITHIRSTSAVHLDSTHLRLDNNYMLIIENSSSLAIQCVQVTSANLLHFGEAGQKLDTNINADHLLLNSTTAEITSSLNLLNNRGITSDNSSGVSGYNLVSLSGSNQNSIGNTNYHTIIYSSTDVQIKNTYFEGFSSGAGLPGTGFLATVGSWGFWYDTGGSWYVAFRFPVGGIKTAAMS